MAQKELTGGKLLVDTGCIVAFTAGIRYDVRQAGDLKSMLFGREGLFLWAGTAEPGSVKRSLPSCPVLLVLLAVRPSNLT